MKRAHQSTHNLTILCGSKCTMTATLSCISMHIVVHHKWQMPSPRINGSQNHRNVHRPANSVVRASDGPTRRSDDDDDGDGHATMGLMMTTNDDEDEGRARKGDPALHYNSRLHAGPYPPPRRSIGSKENSDESNHNNVLILTPCKKCIIFLWIMVYYFEIKID